MPRILVVEGEEHGRHLLRGALDAKGYDVITTGTAAGGIEAVRIHHPDLLILALDLPDMDGQEVISAVREFSTTPIIVVSVRALEVDKVEALDRGANDYVVRPFGMPELLARVHARLRASRQPAADAVIRAGWLDTVLVRGIVTRDGVHVRLSRKESELLSTLARHAGKVVPYGEILAAVWGPDYADDIAHLRVYISQLRRKLGADPALPIQIMTEAGVGYRLRTIELREHGQ